jgi:hypothetical protein
VITVPDFLQPLEKTTSPFPREAVQAAVERREESFPILLDALKSVIEHPGDIPGDYLLHEYALRLLAQFRDARAYPLAVAIARLPEVDALLGDTITSDLGQIMASVSGGDPKPIQELIEDDAAEEFARSAGLTALGVLCREGQLSREDFSEYLRSLFEGRLAREESFVWTALADVCSHFGFAEHERAVREAWDAHLVDPTFADWADLEAEIRSGKFQEKKAAGYSFLDDVSSSMMWWHCFTPEAALDDDDVDDEEDPADDKLPGDPPSWEAELDEIAEVPGPIRAEPKIGRNDPCPCGSGKKFKKCCG